MSRKGRKAAPAILRCNRDPGGAAHPFSGRSGAPARPLLQKLCETVAPRVQGSVRVKVIAVEAIGPGKPQEFHPPTPNHPDRPGKA